MNRDRARAYQVAIELMDMAMGMICSLQVDFIEGGLEFVYNQNHRRHGYGFSDCFNALSSSLSSHLVVVSLLG
jgi:hypothetical protein